ncbi:MAG: hypothetical protein GY834_17415, partial [Bacteroidetes bacterium]|nr:hypothetical protein [Bacteroidota bacterium]
SVGHSQSCIESTSTVRYNVILDARDIETSPRGFGITIGNRQVDTIVDDNIIAHQVSGKRNIYAIFTESDAVMDHQELCDQTSDCVDDGDSCPQYYSNPTITNNIVYEWNKNGAAGGEAIHIGGGLKNGITFQNNIIEQSSAVKLIRINHGTYTDDPDENWDLSDNSYYATGSTTPFRNDSAELTFAQWSAVVGENNSVNTSTSFTDPERTIETYARLKGLNPSNYSDGLQKFLDMARQQSRFNWNEEYMALAMINYIRAGFDKETIDYGYSTIWQ